MQVSESTCSGASNSIGSSNVFATYTSTKNQTLDDNQSISSSLDKVLCKLMLDFLILLHKIKH